MSKSNYPSGTILLCKKVIQSFAQGYLVSGRVYVVLDNSFVGPINRDRFPNGEKLDTGVQQEYAEWEVLG